MLESITSDDKRMTEKKMPTALMRIAAKAEKEVLEHNNHIEQLVRAGSISDSDLEIARRRIAVMDEKAHQLRLDATNAAEIMDAKTARQRLNRVNLRSSALSKRPQTAVNGPAGGKKRSSKKKKKI